MGRTSFSPKYSCHCWMMFIVIFYGYDPVFFWISWMTDFPASTKLFSCRRNSENVIVWHLIIHHATLQVSQWGALAAWFSLSNCRQMSTVIICTVVAFRDIHHELLCSALQNKKLLDLNSSILKPCLSVVKALAATCVYTDKLAFS